jgi:hypothetical protein
MASFIGCSFEDDDLKETMVFKIFLEFYLISEPFLPLHVYLR